MISGVLTLFSWTLRSDVRAVWPHLVRAGFAIFMLFSISVAWVDVFAVVGPGLRFFEKISYLNVLLITVSGISYFVGAVTEEKDSGNLALLRLAGVTPLAIILGKSTSRLISALMLLLIQLPFTFLAITLGGITWQQVLASYVALATYLAFVCNIALFCSVRCATSSRAAGAAAVTMLLFFAVSAIISGFLSSFPASRLPGWIAQGLEGVAGWQQQASITVRLNEILSSTSGGVSLTDSQTWWSLGLAIVLFLASIAMFDRWSVPQESLVQQGDRIMRRVARGRCWRLAVLWKDLQFFTGGFVYGGVRLVVYGLIVAGTAYLRSTLVSGRLFWPAGDMIWDLFLLLLLLLSAELLFYSSGSLFSEVRQTTVAGLVLLPLRTERILLEKAGAVAVALSPAVFWTGVVYLMDPAAISEHCSATMVVSAVSILLLSSHLTVLLSLYTRWAALPLALLLTAVGGVCCPIFIFATFMITNAISRSQQLESSLLLGSVVSLVQIWLFVLLPIQTWIVSRWNLLSQQE